MPEIVNDTDIRLDEKDYDSLEADFRRWIEQVEKSRAKRLDIWEKAAKNYDGDAPVMQLPWMGASNAVLNITQSHTDSIQARLFAAGATQDPTYLTMPATGEPIRRKDGSVVCEASEYAQWWQEISKHIEIYEVNHRAAIEEATWLSTLYGDSWIYVSWVRDSVMDVEADAKGQNLVKTERVITDQPVLTVLHPERVYIAPWDDDAQQAKTVGFDFPLDEHDLLIKERRKTYAKKRVEKLQKLMRGEKLEEGGALVREMDKAGYLKEWGSSEVTGLRSLLSDQGGIDPSATPNALTMLKVFQRIDIDGDGIPEEIQFEVEKKTGTVAVARYHNLLHRRRPLVHFYYSRRPGSPYNKGVPEILFNAQKVLNNLIRDLLNNNKVRNTKIFLAAPGSGITKQSQIYPSRLIKVQNVDTDFKVLDLGSAGAVTNLSEISLIQMWAERLTGVSDANLGLEKKSRTPVGTTQALLEEGSKRLDRIVDRQREAQQDLWAQILSLYRQNKDPRTLAMWARVEEGDIERFLEAWTLVKPQDITDFIQIKPQVSTSVFNRAAQKQEVLTVMGQVQNYYAQIIQLAGMVGGAVAAGDQSFASLILAMAKGGHQLMKKFLTLHDMKEQDDLNPDELIAMLEGVTSVPVEQGEIPGSPAEAAAGASAGGAQPGEFGEAAGRPVAGLPRVPGESDVAPISGGGTQ